MSGREGISLSAPTGRRGLGEVGILRIYVNYQRFLRRRDPPHPKSFSPLKGGEGLLLHLTTRTFAPLTAALDARLRGHDERGHLSGPTLGFGRMSRSDG